MNDERLIELARKGNEAAIHLLYERYAPRVFAAVRRFADDDALAEDWAQDAWISAIRGLRNFRGDARFSTWLHRIAVNSALQGLRQRDRKDGKEVPLPDTLPGRRGGDQTLLRLQLERAIEELPPGMRKVLILYDVEGYTHDEIAARLGVSPGTSKSQLFKARAKMRELLGSRTTMMQEVER